MKIKERYASAVNSSNLKSRESTVMSDTDVLGAYGIADRRLSSGEDHYTKHPLAVPLERLFTGDSTAGLEIVRILAVLILGKANRLHVSISRVQARDMAKVILGWFRSPRCRVCGGHGFKVIKHSTTLGDTRCIPCDATGIVQLELLFPFESRELVKWATARMELEVELAAPAAMKALASKMDF